MGFVESSFVWSGSTIRFDLVAVFFVCENICSRTLYFSLIIVKSLQLRGRRQIVEPRKYCLVRVIAFFGVCFLYFFLFLIGWDFGEIPFTNNILGHLKQNINTFFFIYIFLYLLLFWSKLSSYLERESMYVINRLHG